LYRQKYDARILPSSPENYLKISSLTSAEQIVQQAFIKRLAQCASLVSAASSKEFFGLVP
jgi:hypothetical protein